MKERTRGSFGFNRFARAAYDTVFLLESVDSSKTNTSRDHFLHRHHKSFEWGLVIVIHESHCNNVNSICGGSHNPGCVPVPRQVTTLAPGSLNMSLSSIPGLITGINTDQKKVLAIVAVSAKEAGCKTTSDDGRF